ncbi:hypothetical protein [Yeosuana sp.]|uniref:hypothetical protein n=1 Tax=Yeosuana sp. TaxID=2529388 RepID=UPI0040550699
MEINFQKFETSLMDSLELYPISGGSCGSNSNGQRTDTCTNDSDGVNCDSDSD